MLLILQCHYDRRRQSNKLFPTRRITKSVRGRPIITFMFAQFLSQQTVCKLIQRVFMTDISPPVTKQSSRCVTRPLEGDFLKLKMRGEI